MISVLAEYSLNNNLEVNLKKTKGMIFNKTGRFIRSSYRLNDKFIYTTDTYQYLGFLFTPYGGINWGLKNLKERALRAYYSLKRKMGPYFRLNITTTIFIFNTLIKPILLYSSDFWGCLKMPRNNPLESVQNKFYKELLGVQRQTSNVGVILELGEIPIVIDAKKNNIKNYSRIFHLKQASPILKSATQPLSNENTWMSAVTSHLDKIGIGTNVIQKVHQKAYKRMSDIFYQEAFIDINRDNSKLRTFGKIKRIIGIEKYLLHPLDLETRTILSKFRLSNHDLMIEKGRHIKLDKTERFCPFCPTLIETEFHFLLHCDTFSRLRREQFHCGGRAVKLKLNVPPRRTTNKI